jgi:hypothetical protein
VSTAKPRTVIVCLPAGAPGDWLTATVAAADHLPGPAQLACRFPVRHRRLVGWLTRFLGYALIGARHRHGVVATAAGGRLGRLNLRLAGQAAWLDACARWAVWQLVTRGLRHASPWEHYLDRHQARPGELSLEQARRMFLRQPAIAAMLAHNAIPGTGHQLDPYEIDAYQAGVHAYATRYMLTAVAGDAMLTADGQWLEPATDAFTDVLAYLQPAAGHLRRLGRRHRIVALTT